VPLGLHPCPQFIYLDLAMPRDFRRWIAVLDQQARDSAAIIAGASSVPAAVGSRRAQSRRRDGRGQTVDIAISASNSASAGSSVSAAILSYVGKPIQLWQGDGWIRGWGWQESSSPELRRAGVVLHGRWLALADVPDLD